MITIFRYSNYKSEQDGNGAEKRTAQISGILDNNGYKWKLLPTGNDPGCSSFEYFYKLFKSTISYIKVLFIIRRVCNPLLMYKTIRLISHFTGVFDLSKAADSKVIIWESTKMDFSYVVPLFLDKGFSIIALPHNIESLVSLQKSGITGKASPDWLPEEIRLLKQCNFVFTISKEETILLKQFSINAGYLPYYPTVDVFSNLMRIRKLRENSKKSNEKKQILLLGSAVNPPTKEGMLDRIKVLSKPENDFCVVIVAGYGTESLKNNIPDTDRIRYLGELTNDQLNNILIESDAILMHQPATSGALTRIVESLIAGIPVLANFESARNYYNLDGVHVYNEDEELFDLIKNEFSIPMIPKKPIQEYNAFLKKLVELNN